MLSRFRTLRPIRARKTAAGQVRACSAAFGDNGCQAVAVTADRCSSRYPQLRSGSVGTARARLSSPPDRLYATWPTHTLHSIGSARAGGPRAVRRRLPWVIAEPGTARARRDCRASVFEQDGDEHIGQPSLIGLWAAAR